MEKNKIIVIALLVVIIVLLAGIIVSMPIIKKTDAKVLRGPLV